MSKNNFSVSDMYCTCCGQKSLPIARVVGHYKEPGHLKKLYCFHCNKVCNHVEIKPTYNDYNLQDFKLEIKYHNFDEMGNRKEPYRIFRGNLKQKGLVI